MTRKWAEHFPWVYDSELEWVLRHPCAAWRKLEIGECGKDCGCTWNENSDYLIGVILTRTKALTKTPAQ